MANLRILSLRPTLIFYLVGNRFRRKKKVSVHHITAYFNGLSGRVEEADFTNFWLFDFCLHFCLHFSFCLQKPHAKSHELYLEAVEEPQFILGVKRTVTAVGLFVKNLFRAISESWSCKKFLLQFLDSFLLVMNLHNLLGVKKQF